MSYRIEPFNRYVEANRRIVESEIHPGRTVTFIREVDLTQVEAVRAAAGPSRPSYTSFVVKAVGMALQAFPYANRRLARRVWLPWVGPRLQRFEHSDVAVAIERDIPGAEGVAYVDVVRQAGERSLAAVREDLAALAQATVATNPQWQQFSSIVSRLPSWLSSRLIRVPFMVPSQWPRYRGAAALVSSPAKYGVDAVLAAWSWPIGVSFGLVKPRPVVRQGKVVAAPTFYLTLNFDRRVMAGAQGARFFNFLVETLEQAESTMVGTQGQAHEQAA